MKHPNPFWKIVIALIFIIVISFCLKMMDLETKQKRIDELKDQVEQNEKEYEELHTAIQNLLDEEI